MLVTLAVTVLCLWRVTAYPGLVPSRDRLRENVKLGLDLRGGTHLVLQVVTDDAIRGQTDRAIEATRQELNKRNIVFRQLTRTQGNTFEVAGVDPAKDSDVRAVLNEQFRDWDLISTSTGAVNSYMVRLKPAPEKAYREQSIDQAINTIRNRIDELGVGEVVIQKHGGPGEDQILVQLPGVDDPARVKTIIQNTAQLELKLVESGPFSSKAAAVQSYGGMLPGSLEILPSAERDASSSAEEYYVVQQVAVITGQDLKSAYAARDQNGRPAVKFDLNADGAARFSQVTGANIGRQLAIVLDNRIQSAPRIE
jgi:preprotein translocase subunit SecD